MQKRKPSSPILLFSLLSIILYGLFAYTLERENYSYFAVLYLGLFVLFGGLYQQSEKNLSFLIGLSVLFRLIFLLAIPNLSQDFYRFIWDGRMILEHLNPYLTTPESFISVGELPVNQAQLLYEGMGSLNGSHYTNYPPANQFCFFIAALLSNKSILGAAIIMRLLIIFPDVGIIWFGSKLLAVLKLPAKNILLYALNPFTIIELTGNLHFEPVMLFFLVWSLYMLINQKWMIAAILLGLSVSVKLIPLLFLPLFFQWFVKKNLKGFFKYVWFCLIVLLTFILLFLPFYSTQLIDNYTNSVGLWFNKFEFNASLYYLARAIGYTFRGYNEIAIIGKILPLLAIAVLLVLTFFRENKSPIQLITALLLGLTFYYFTTTTMHPWYIATLLILCVFTKYRYPILWTIAILLSYQVYANPTWHENLVLIAMEYAMVYAYLLWEIFNKKSSTSSSLKGKRDF